MIELTGFISFLPGFKDEKIAMLTTELSIKDLLELYKIDNTVNRDIADNRIYNLSKYIEEIDTSMGIYLPALIAAYEGSDPVIERNTCLLERERSFIVIDGQHRIKALEYYLKKENNTLVKNQILDSKITLQLYFNLTDNQKRQLFIEINGNSKRVGKNLAVKYDDRNVVNSLITSLLKNKSSNPLHKMGVEINRNRIVRPKNKNWISLTRLSKFISILLFGTNKTTLSNNAMITKQYEQIYSFLQQYFIILESALPNEPGNAKTNLLGHEALQNAIALLCHEKIISTENKKVLINPNWKELVELLGYIDFGTRSEIFKGNLIRLGSADKYWGFPDNKHNEIFPEFKKEFESLI